MFQRENVRHLLFLCEFPPVHGRFVARGQSVLYAVYRSRNGTENLRELALRLVRKRRAKYAFNRDMDNGRRGGPTGKPEQSETKKETL